MHEPVTVACVQAEPAILDREGTLDKLAALTAEAAAAGASLVVFPETFVPAYPSSVWAKYLAGWGDERAKAAFALLARESVAVPGPAADRLGSIAREHGVWLVTGVNEVDPGRPGTIYNTLLYHAPDGSLAQRHRKLVPTNHERLVWGQGDGSYLAGPVYEEETILYAELDPTVLREQRQRFDPAGHYHRPDVLGLRVSPLG